MKSKWTILAAAALLCASFSMIGAGRGDLPPLISPRPETEETVQADFTGWKDQTDGTRYYQNGTAVSGWLKIDGIYYYLDPAADNILAKNGWRSYKGKWYYFYEDGRMAADTWEKIDGKWYSFYSWGGMRTGWYQPQPGTWYYLNRDGSMAGETWKWIDDTWYYFSPSGTMKTGWIKDRGSWYFSDRSGAMLTGYIHDGKAWYYLTDSGKWDPDYTGSEILPNGRTLTIKNDRAYVDGILLANKKYPLPRSHAPGGLTQETSAALSEMQNGAAKDGINLFVVSGYRSYDNQVYLYNHYVNRDGKAEADRYSARPGHSEHQTGLCFDLNHAGEAFHNTKEAAWLEKHAHEYGFIVRFPRGKENETGYMYESWHMRYIGKDFAAQVHESGLCLEEFLGVDSYYIY